MPAYQPMDYAKNFAISDGVKDQLSRLRRMQEEMDRKNAVDRVES